MGGEGDDVLQGDDGNDTLDSGAGNNALRGANGDDSLFLDADSTTQTNDWTFAKTDQTYPFADSTRPNLNGVGLGPVNGALDTETVTKRRNAANEAAWPLAARSRKSA